LMIRDKNYSPKTGERTKHHPGGNRKKSTCNLDQENKIKR